LLLERKVGNFRGLRKNQESFATTVKNRATTPETIINREEHLEGRYFMHLLLISRKNLQTRGKRNPPMNKKKNLNTFFISTLSKSIKSSVEIWLVDTGASRYMM